MVNTYIKKNMKNGEDTKKLEKNYYTDTQER